MLHVRLQPLSLHAAQLRCRYSPAGRRRSPSSWRECRFNRLALLIGALAARLLVQLAQRVEGPPVAVRAVKSSSRLGDYQHGRPKGRRHADHILPVTGSPNHRPAALAHPEIARKLSIFARFAFHECITLPCSAAAYLLTLSLGGVALAFTHPSEVSLDQRSFSSLHCSPSMLKSISTHVNCVRDAVGAQVAVRYALRHPTAWRRCACAVPSTASAVEEGHRPPG